MQQAPLWTLACRSYHSLLRSGRHTHASTLTTASQSKFRPQTQLPAVASAYRLMSDTSSPSSTESSCKSFHKYKPAMDAPPGVFRGCVDRFNGITIDSNEEFEANVKFVDKLQKSIDHWKQVGRRAIWFKINLAHSEWIPVLSKNNFDFHHAKAGFVLMFRWLPEQEPVNLPAFAHTMVGVGGLVVNDKNEVLVITDRFALIPQSWKLPGGYVEPKEDFIDAAIREVEEETGISTKFRTVISLRHAHNSSWGCSDIYIVVALAPLNLELKPCEREISRIQWMPVAEYLQHPHVHETNRHFMQTYLDYQKQGIRFTCELAQHQVLKKKYCLYFMKPLPALEEPAGDAIEKA